MVSGESRSFSWLATLVEQGMVEGLVVALVALVVLVALVALVALVVLVVQFSVVVVECYHVGIW